MQRASVHKYGRDSQPDCPFGHGEDSAVPVGYHVDAGDEAPPQLGYGIFDVRNYDLGPIHRQTLPSRILTRWSDREGTAGSSTATWSQLASQHSLTSRKLDGRIRAVVLKVFPPSPRPSPTPP